MKVAMWARIDRLDVLLSSAPLDAVSMVNVARIVETVEDSPSDCR